MRYWTMWVAVYVLIVSVGCATDPKYMIEEGRYQDHEYSFSVDIPLGWTYYEQIPDDLQEEAGLNFQKDHDGPFLFDASTEGTIHINRLTMDGNWSDFDDMSESQKQEVASVLVDAVLKGMTLFPLSGHHRYEGGLSTTHANWRRNNRSFKPVKLVDYTYQSRETTGYSYIYGESVLYPCFSGQTCMLLLTLASKQGHQCEDMESFCAFVSSLKAHDTMK